MIKSIKIIYIISSSHIAGTEIHLLNLIKKIKKIKKFKIEVICTGGELEKRIKEIGIKTKKIPMRNKYDIKSLFLIYKYINNEDFDIVHTHLGISSLLGRIAAKLSGVSKIIMTEHLWSDFNEDMNYLVNKIHLFIYFLLAKFTTDKIIAVSEAVKSFLVNEAWVSKNKVKVIYNGVEVKKNKTYNFKKNKFIDKYNINKKDFLIGIIGRLSAEKGHKYLFEAIKKNKNNNFKLLVIGEGKLENELKEYANKENIEDKIIFTGFIDDIDLIYSLIDLIILPSVRECLPMVLLEAMNYEIPAIASNVGGVSEVIKEGENGLLVEPKNVEEINEALNFFLENSNKIKRMGKNGKLILINKFSEEEMIQKTVDIYLDI